MRSLLRLTLVAVTVAFTVSRGFLLDAQVRPVYDRGAAGLTQVLLRLQTTASALHTGAHPDDEDSAFIARTARGDHARTAYLSLTRGEGGQNVIGPELFDALGVIRTEELLQARRLDGGEQFFTRAIDFGFSKRRAEAAAKWNERDVLDDMVRVIRTFRPLVVVSRFAGTETDGHGHHQMAGHLTPLAFRAAGRTDEFPQHFADGLRPWQARKLYRSFRGQGADALVLGVVTGIFDPAIGRAYSEIAAEGRSQHKSQEMGSVEPRGDLRSTMRLMQVAGPDGPHDAPPQAAGEQSIFDGIDTSATGIPAIAGLPGGALRDELRLVADSARQAFEQYAPLQPARIVPALASGLKSVRAARTALAGLAAATADARAHADFLLAHKEGEFADALARAAGVVVDALADQETPAQGSEVGVSVRAFFPDASLVRITGTRLTAPAGWTTSPASGPRRATDAERPDYTVDLSVAVPVDAELTQPYFLAAPRDGDRYRWTATAPRGLPFEEGPLVAHVTMDIGGETVTLDRRVDYRYADRVRGEIRRNVNVVPPLTVAVDSPLLIVPIGQSSRHRVTVTTTSMLPRQEASATVRLRLPTGWTSTPTEETVTLGSGDRHATEFIVTAPAQATAGRVEITASATLGGVAYAREMQVIAYPHIETHRLYRASTVGVQVVDLQVAPVTVGYVMGSGDQIPEALQRMGVDVTLLDAETLARGDLSRFDTIVIGVRASEARPDFAAEHARLMEYVRRGGTLVVQYQQLDYLARNLPPYPGAAPQGAANSRVTDETAPVTILVPGHPVFTFPNRITAADFDGWVQERNLYAFPQPDARYTALLQTVDPGEAPQRGGEVYARIGEGQYVYTAYAWFRQLPAGVPGAYRQFANLISLSKAP